MSDYPDPEEEYELMYADDLELLRDQDDLPGGNVIKTKAMQAKRSLDFTSPPSNPPISTPNGTNEPVPQSADISLTPNLPNIDDQTINGSVKRTADELFGDIGDIDFDDVQLPSKRQKTEEENDLELIDKIMEARKLRQMMSEPSRRAQIDLTNYSIKDNISLDIPRWAFVPVTNSDGDRMYIRLESEDTWYRSLDTATDCMPLQSTYAKTWEEARQILETKLDQSEQQVQIQTQPDPTELATTSLWVEKYKPQSYVDLLSEEPVNRALLYWLHLWDKIVFKKEVKTKEPQQRNSFSKRAGQFQLTNKWRGKKDMEPELDPDGRPHHKVALLCGPPGVGKTTLAHLLAKLAGYRPVELNASDERSTDAFRNALQSATLMRSVIDAEKRPNCLILDEIDGAPLPTVELLVKWCTATLADGKKKGSAHPLRRPVVAICNDLYATSLRPLRSIALVIQVGGVSIPRLASRLARVADCEKLKVAPHVLSALAARAAGDVRAAIQVLSFIKAKARSQLSLTDVENAAIGSKDCNKSLMQGLQAIFTLNEKSRVDVLKVIQSAGEYERLIDGIFENYPTARIDSRLLVAGETLSWLCLYDAINSWTMRHQNYSLYGMLPLCIKRCHTILASRNQFRFKFPTTGLEMSRKAAEISGIISAVVSGCSPRVVANKSAISLDVIPLLPYVLCPKLRSANVQMCSDSERAALRTCAGALCDYGLRYIQVRTADGLYAFQLDHDVYRVAFFGNEDRVKPSPVLRQAIAREQQLEIIRRNEALTGPPSSQVRAPDKSKVAAAKLNDKDAKEVRIPNHLQRLEPIAVTAKAPQVHKDFFGRIVPLSQVVRSEAIPDVISSSQVFYHYREGFNNAVRRNVRLKDLL